MADLDKDILVSSELTIEAQREETSTEVSEITSSAPQPSLESLSTDVSNVNESSEKPPENQTPKDTAATTRVQSSNGASSQPQPKRFNTMNINKKFLEKVSSTSNPGGPSSTSAPTKPGANICQSINLTLSSLI